MAIKLGSVVRQKVKPIEGVVDDYGLDKDNGAVTLHVQFVDADTGDTGARFFREDEVEVISGPLDQEEDPAAPKAATSKKK